MKKSAKAFSLLEMIFAIVIIGIIASVALPKLFNTKNNALVATLKQDIVTVTSAVQSAYLLNNSLEKISDAVVVNGSIWQIEDQKITYNDKENECVTIELKEKTLEVNINEDVSTICKKLFDTGIVDVSYELN
ncbi:MAG: prepilin-type N-terminal cleavage/methylation domain-containing protein [Candidatus Marinarcus sp.]|uniref:prepilin-type N-terminal cleavage/methylation domain-containing protein n=1 Tax=Candidatus Marinarcus sp. TaxID=3100987 RepID=UPI003AFF983E